MASKVQMPKLSDTMTEGTIQKWLVKEGQKVRAGDPLAEVETDKATLEMEAYEAGTVLKILVGDGATAQVGAAIAVIGKEGENWQAALGGEAQAPAAPVAPAATAAPQQQPAAPAPSVGKGKASAVQMPKLSDTMTEGTIQKWLVKEGQKVRAGDPIAEVETDKATLEMEAYEGGTLLKIIVGDGSPAKVGAPIAVIGEAGADWQAAVAALGGAPAAAAAPAPAAPVEQKGAEVLPFRPAAPSPAAPARTGPLYQAPTTPGEIVGLTFGFGHGIAPAVPVAPKVGGEKVRASPVARKLAAEHGVDLTTVRGTGPSGRILRRDVEEARKVPAVAAPAAAVAAARPAAPSGLPGETVPLSQMRKAIARNLQQSKREIPHFYLTMDIDMAEAMALRAQLKDAGIAVSVNDLILRAVTVAAMEVPRIQGQLQGDDAVFVPGTVNLAVAVALDEGLITPVVRSAEKLSIGELSRQVRELAGKARDKKLRPEEYSGGTITVSNLGMFDIEHFYAIVNPGQASIVSVGKVRKEPVVQGDEIVVGQRMRIGYSGDHRVVDGAVGAVFLQAVKKALEHPMQMLVG